MASKERPGFMVYFDDWEIPRRLLNDTEFKTFFDAIFDYARDGEVPPSFENQTIEVLYENFKNKIEKDVERYMEVCRKRSEAGKKAHAPQPNEYDDTPF